ncbi:TonB-dependent siderophore receptor [Cobetia marina]|uniref:TonB-dependent siderophore receptor n=1 Tax=Cobetia marina TaxID=28258 RepID=A0ABU9GC89_COBMA|nr:MULTISPECIES: TonB-dependent siderophore receptor [Cobetia]MDA5563080.1 TonB-dependent siderophore receptor [Cobetia sp. MMG027]MDH2373239.1 TonB-dependent siderophore receptor [Cobetia sp. 3AK]MDI6003301.1 TonB-dependent siderophore receptor [Cobetia pacifica]MDN2655744.1 TonB-dependent siderophore receptor [Cobetia sp. 14N.309.X.WAT.E.A4]MDO6787126.1 TonB-dependent siderophore receptor [Cobetia marina]
MKDSATRHPHQSPLLSLPRHPLALAIALSLPFTGQAVAADHRDAQDEQLDTMTVTTTAATKTQTGYLETPQAVSTITRDDIDKRAAETVQRAADYTPGVFTNQIGASNRYDYLVLRGFSDGSVSNTFLDGLKLMGDSGSYSSMTIDPYFLDSIEVVKGPSSVLYGRSSPGGLVAMQSKRPEFQDSGQVRFTVGDDNERSAAFDLTGPLDDEKRIAYRLTGLASAEDTQVDSVSEERYAFSPQITMDVTDDTTVTLMGYFQKDPEGGYHSGLPYEGTVVSHDGIKLGNDFYEGDEDYEEFDRTERMLGYDFEHRFNDDVTARQKFRYLRSDVDLEQVYAYGWASDTELTRYYSGGEESLRAWTVDNQLETRFSTGDIDHTLLFGADYQTRTNDVDWEYGTASSLDVTSSSDADVSIYATENQKRELDQTGVYLQDQLSWGRWNLAAGLRQDWVNIKNTDRDYNTSSELNDNEMSGRIGLIYGFDNGISPYVSYSTSFSPNSYTDEDGDLLDPTTGKQVEVGMKYQPNGTRDQYSVSLFRINQENVASKDPEDSYYTSYGEIESQGLELEARTQLTRDFALQAGYSYTDVTYAKAEDGTEGNDANQVPKHQVSVWGDYAFNEGPLTGLNAGLGVRYYADMWADSENTEKVPNYALVDALVGYDLSQVGWSGTSVQLNVSNLFDKEYIASCYSTSFCYYGAERSVTATLTYDF